LLDLVNMSQDLDSSFSRLLWGSGILLTSRYFVCVNIEYNQNGKFGVETKK